MDNNDRRSIERVPAGEDVIITYKNSIFLGTVLNITEVGMFIGTKISFPPGAILLIENNLIKILGRVKRSTEINGFYDGVGVELSEPAQEYIEYINSLKAPF